MKQIFFDKEKLVVIKVFSSLNILRRELCGAKSFSLLVRVPQMEVLDTKVLKISLLEGFLGYQVSEEDLNLVIASFLLKKKPLKRSSKFSITEEIKKLQKDFQDDLEIILKLRKILQEIQNRELFPVHGDLQKQNIIIGNSNLGLIDFEHFILAPKELEVCNSLFFNDGNCLDIPGILKKIPEGFFDKKAINLMLEFFAIKQISFGMSKFEAEKRLKMAQKKVDGLTFGHKKVNLAKEERSGYYFI